MRTDTRTRPIRITATALGLVVGLLAMLPGTAAGFGDVDSDRYYADAVRWMVSEGITEGVELGCFGPDLAVTRGQVAAFLHRLDESAGNEPESVDHPFADVRADYQQDPVGWLYSAGLTTGVSASRFAPNASITRGDFAVLLWRYAGEPAADAPHGFRDVTRSYQQEAIAWMSENGITTGTSATTFTPDGRVTRGQAAAFLFRFVDPTTIAAATGDATPCTREHRVALEYAGLTPTEARCAVPFLVDFDVDYLLDVAEDRATASFDLIVAAAGVGGTCLTPDRIADLSRIFL